MRRIGYVEAAGPHVRKEPAPMRRSFSSFFVLPMRRGLPFLAAALVLLARGSCRADGGAIIARETVNGLNLTVFAAPVPLRAGPADVSVLVQDAQGQAILDATVEIGWTSAVPAASPDWLPPCCSMNTLQGLTPALRSHSQNKLLYGALLPIRSAGESEISVHVKSPQGEASLNIPINAAPPRAPLLAYWPLLAFPPVAIGLFAVHQRLSRHESPKRRQDTT